MSAEPLPLPPHFAPERAGRVWRVPYGDRAREAAEWARRHGIRPAAADTRRVCLLLIDCQNTFCLPEFELFVAGRSGRGAVENSVRICEFLYRNLDRITEIRATLDTHTAFQIFHPVFWVDAAGEHPAGGRTLIGPEDLERGVWRVNPDAAASLGMTPGALQGHALHYVRRLTDGGKYPLMVWPYHAMQGGIGHALVSIIEESIFFHGIARGSQAGFEVKGTNPLTENYSALSPEVLEGPRGPIAAKNTRLIETLLGFDEILVAGQAKSHCVAWTVEDLLEEIRARDPGLARKVVLLEDCASPVVIPGVIDFTEQAEGAYARFTAAGIRTARSTDRIPAGT